MIKFGMMRFLAASGALVSILGCSGDDGPKTYPVTGTVTQNNKPVEGAIVSFTSASVQPASGVTDTSGKYELATKAKGDGAMAGTYQVTIAKYDTNAPEPTPPGVSDLEDPYDITNEYPDGYNEMEASEIAASISKNLLPAKYSRTATSGLEATVTEAGENKFDFDLE